MRELPPAQPETPPLPGDGAPGARPEGERTQDGGGWSGVALWLALAPAAALTVWWLRAAQVAHFYDRYYRFAAAALGVAALCLLVVFAVAWAHRPGASDAPTAPVDVGADPPASSTE